MYVKSEKDSDLEKLDISKKLPYRSLVRQAFERSWINYIFLSTNEVVFVTCKLVVKDSESICE